MRFGACVGTIEQIRVLAHAGYDFCELPAAAVQPFDDDTAALPALHAIAAAPLQPEAFNILVPGSLPMVRANADHGALRAYLRRAFERMVQLGGAVAVLGSGAARRIPDGMDRSAALDQLRDALALAADEADRVGMVLALEHLNHGECNVFTSLQECLHFVHQRDLASLRVLADLHHLALEHEPFEHVVDAAPLLAHVHVADGDRRAPGAGGYDYAGFMMVLHKIGYDQRMCAECRWNALATEAAPALAFMREQWRVTLHGGPGTIDAGR